MQPDKLEATATHLRWSLADLLTRDPYYIQIFLANMAISR